VARKGFAEIFADFDADFFCLQETKLQAGQIDLEFPGYKSYWDYAEKKGYSGTVIYTRKEPLSVAYGLGIPEHDTEGRAVTLEFPDFYLVNTYVPNSGEGLKRLDYRMTWDDAFREYVRGLAGKKSVIICGDLNVAHHEIDLKNPETNRLNAGFTDEERENMTALLAAGFTDTWRFQHPEEVKYSWWSYRMMARDRNIGWRIDYFLVSNDLISRIGSTDIHNEVFGSDHCPVELVINGK
jgi:exodeoxyribonuclease-3